MRAEIISCPTSSRPSQPVSLNFLSFFLLFLLLLAIFQTPIVFVYAPPPTVRYVPSVDYPTIQSAIDVSKRGDIVQVSPGTYYEHLIVPVALLTIRGENKETTIIDADTTGTAISLEANGITVTGFTLQNGGYNAGIQTYTYDSHNISNNIIENFTQGIYFSDSDSNIISGNTFFNNSMYAVNLRVSLNSQIIYNSISESAFGLYLYYADGAMIMRNSISNTSYGIFVNHSSQDTIKENTCQSNSWGIDAQSSDDLTIRDNTISGGAYSILLQTTHYSQISNNSLTQASYGLYLVHSNDNTIVGWPSPGNLMAKNNWGLALYNSTGNMIIDGNTIAQNTWGISLAASSSGNTIYHNNFVSNVKQASQDWDLTNTWWNGANEGNYWNDYTGYPPASGVDYHPLLEPWPLRNIATTNVMVSKTQAYPGNIITVNVTVINLGVITETFEVTAYFNSTQIGTQTTTLTPDSSTTLTYNWNTTNVDPNYYVISAIAGPIPYIEVDSTDNSLTDGTIHVKITGDINGDGTINIFDAAEVSAHWYPGPPIGPLGYDANADINSDGAVDLADAAIVSANWGMSE